MDLASSRILKYLRIYPIVVVGLDLSDIFYDWKLGEVIKFFRIILLFPDDYSG